MMNVTDEFRYDMMQPILTRHKHVTFIIITAVIKDIRLNELVMEMIVFKLSIAIANL